MADTDDITALLGRQANPDDNPREEERSSSCWSKAKKCLKAITVEPVLIMLLFSIGVESVFIKNLWIDKICYFHFHYSEAVCRNLDSGRYSDEQGKVQRAVSDYNLYKHIIEYLPAVFVVLLLGSWSDSRGRRLPIIIPLVGYLLTSLGTTMTCYWWSLPPLYLLLCYIPLAFTGGIIGLYAGVYSYLSAVTSGKARTSRMSIILVIMTLAVAFSHALGLLVYAHGGYVAIFGLQALLVATAILYAMVRLEDRPGVSDEARDRPTTGVLEVLSPSRLKQTLMVAFKKREGRKRGDILGHVTIMMAMVFIAGSYGYLFLYTRKKFSWDYKAFTIWGLVEVPLSVIGTLVIVPVLSYWWGVEDSVLGLMGGISMLFNNVLKATAPAPWAMYLSSVTGICIGQVTASSRSAISKLVDKSDLGAIFAVLAAGEAAIPMFSATVFTVIYKSTLDFFPGMIFILTALLSIVICCIYVWVMTKERDHNRYDADFIVENASEPLFHQQEEDA